MGEGGGRGGVKNKVGRSGRGGAEKKKGKWKRRKGGRGGEEVGRRLGEEEVMRRG